MFRGTFTALVTPFRNGAIDFAALEKLIESADRGRNHRIGRRRHDRRIADADARRETRGTDPHAVDDRERPLPGDCRNGNELTRDSIEATKFAEKAGRRRRVAGRALL